MTDRTIQLVDVTLRDAHQCLWATRMTTAMMAELAPRLDRRAVLLVNLSGRGDKDMNTVADYLGVRLT